MPDPCGHAVARRNLRPVAAPPERTRRGSAHIASPAWCCCARCAETLIKNELLGVLADVIFEFSKQEPHHRDHGFSVGLEVLLELSMGKRETRSHARKCLCDLLKQRLLPPEALNATIRLMFEKLSSFSRVENAPELETRDVLRSEILMIMVDVAQHVGAEFCQEVMVPQLPDLCTHDSFIVRKNCPAAVAELCRLFQLSPHSGLVLSELTPLYQKFIDDEIWGVRSAAAEHLSIVSEGVPMTSRREIVTPWFCQLAADNSRWVRCAAYKNLGRFIATFVPGISEAGVSQRFEESVAAGDDDIDAASTVLALDGATTTASASDPAPSEAPKVAVSLDDVTDASSSTDFPLGPHDKSALPPSAVADGDTALSPASQRKRRATPRFGEAAASDGAERRATPRFEVASESDGAGERPNITGPVPAGDQGEAPASANDSQYDEEDVEYNNFEYWRQPLPDLSDDLLGEMASLLAGPSAKPADVVKGGGDTAADTAADTAVDTASTATSAAKTTSTLQIPEVLVDHFNKMAHPSSTKLIDDEAARNCAYSIPAIMWVLGKDNWHYIRNTYLQLAGNDDWRVRSTISHSVHLCAQILGRKITEVDLLPKFKTFVEDWDEVRTVQFERVCDAGITVILVFGDCACV